MQLGEAVGGDKTKILKRTALPTSTRPENVDLEYATKLLSLPKELCMHPETSKPISIGIGKFGPYLLYNGHYTSISNVDEIFEISKAEAVKLVDKNEKLNGQVLGQFNSTDVSLNKGRFGPYIKCGEGNIRIPKGVDVNELDLDKAIEIIKNHKPSKSKKAKTKSAKKTTEKKSTKTTAKKSKKKK